MITWIVKAIIKAHKQHMNRQSSKQLDGWTTTTNKNTNKQTNRQTHAHAQNNHTTNQPNKETRQVDRQTNRQQNRQQNWQTNTQTNKQTNTKITKKQQQQTTHSLWQKRTDKEQWATSSTQQPPITTTKILHNYPLTKEGGQEQESTKVPPREFAAILMWINQAQEPNQQLSKPAWTTKRQAAAEKQSFTRKLEWLPKPLSQKCSKSLL